MRDATEERFLIQLFDAVDVDGGVEVAIADKLRGKTNGQTVEMEERGSDDGGLIRNRSG